MYVYIDILDMKNQFIRRCGLCFGVWSSMLKETEQFKLINVVAYTILQTAGWKVETYKRDNLV